ncbi:MAG: AraC family transcriptional regulator [Gemmatimonadota bacterium]
MMLGRRRVQIPSAIIAVAVSTGLGARLRQMVGGAAAVVHAGSVDEAIETVRITRGACVLIVVPVGEESEDIRAFRRFRTLYPHVAVVALFVEGTSSHQGMLALGRSGLTDVLSVDSDLNPNAVWIALARAYAQGVSHRVWEEFQPQIPDALVTLLKTALRVGEAPLTARELANAAGVPERSLRKLCEDAGIPSPQWVIGWARLLIAAHYLEERGRTIQQVAELLAYPSSCALRNQLRRYTGQSPRRLRTEGVTRALCHALERSAALTAELAIQRSLAVVAEDQR